MAETVANFETVINIDDANHRRGDVVLQKIVDKNTLIYQGDVLVGTGDIVVKNNIAAAEVAPLHMSSTAGLPIVSGADTTTGIGYGTVVTAGIADDAVTKTKINADVVNLTQSTQNGISVNLSQEADGSISAKVVSSKVTSAGKADTDVNGKALTSYVSSVGISGTNLVAADGTGAATVNIPITAATATVAGGVGCFSSSLDEVASGDLSAGGSGFGILGTTTPLGGHLVLFSVLLYDGAANDAGNAPTPCQWIVGRIPVESDISGYPAIGGDRYALYPLAAMDRWENSAGIWRDRSNGVFLGIGAPLPESGSINFCVGRLEMSRNVESFTFIPYPQASNVTIYKIGW